MRSIAEIKDQIGMLVEEISLGANTAEKVQDSVRLIEDLGLDSLDYAAVLLGCERWMGIRVREDAVDWGRLQTVGDVARFLHDQQMLPPHDK